MRNHTLLQTTAALFAMGMLAGCLDDLPDVGKVDKLRVLAVVADPPEAGPGDEVTLSALVVDPEGREISYKWAACLAPEQETGFGASPDTATSGGNGYSTNVPPTCVDLATDPETGSQDLGTAATATVTIPEDFLSDDAFTALYGLPAGLPAAITGVLKSIAGANMTISLRVKAGETTLDTFKRVNISTSADKNKNPANVVFHLSPDAPETEPPTTGEAPGGNRCFVGEADGPLEVSPGEWRILPLNIPVQPVTYLVLVNGTGPNNPLGAGTDTCPIPGCAERDEVLFYSAFSTEGGFDPNIQKSTKKSGETVMTIPDDIVGDTLDLWMVTRDGRGGSTFCSSTLTIKK